MSTRSLSLLVAVLVLGIALTLRWYLDAESRAWAATRSLPVEVRSSDLSPADPLAAPESTFHEASFHRADSRVPAANAVRVGTGGTCFTEAARKPSAEAARRTPCREGASAAGFFRGAAGSID